MRTLSASITAEKDKAGTIPRTFFRIFLDNGTLYFTDHTSDITFQGQVYSSCQIKHSPIKTFLENRVDSCTIEINNVDQAMSAYYAASNFEGRKAEIWKVFLNSNLAVIDGNPASDDKIIQFTGNMDLPEINELKLSVRIANLFEREASESPWRRFGTRCNWEFCEADCAYRGGLGPLTGTATGGTIGTLTDTSIPADAYLVNDYWKGGRIKIISGTSAGDDRLISGFDAATKKFTVYLNFSEVIDTTSVYTIECDKARPTCAGFSNVARFDGYEQSSYKLPDVRLSWMGLASTWRHSGIREGGADSAIPLVYGEAAIPGIPIAEGYVEDYKYTRIFALCEGEIDSITSVAINGSTIDLSYASGYQQRLGTAGQSLQRTDFGAYDWELPAADVHYHPRLAYIGIKSKTPFGEYVFDAEGRFKNVLHSSDACVVTLKGLKVQKYLADGTPDGAPAWSNNPVWCTLDFIMNRADKPISSANIDFAYWKAAADTCDTYGWTLNYAITEKMKDPEIIEHMLGACRGYFFYPAGKMALNIETIWSGAVAHTFGDHTIAADNLSNFKYYKKAVNDVFNRVVVKYIDAEIRENMALINGYLLFNAATIPYSDIQGTFAASGTIYIGGEAITYTGKTATELTGCSFRTKGYPSGYPIFQGDQLFPEETAIYNDFAHQADVGKVIPKEIDAKAIPTYRQAYEMAEWFCKKSVQGNQYCSFRGFIDSLHLTVGDVFNLTHSLPGWVDQPFRVISATETMNEEVDYECEFYSDAFYMQNSHLPPARVATTLPNPYDPIGNAGTLALAESGYVGDDGTYVPTLTLTYALPDPAIFWGYAMIQVKVNAGNYMQYGNDYSRGSDFLIDGATAGFKPGDSVTVRVVSVSSNGAISDATTSPTVVEPIDGSIIDPTTPTGLALEGGGTAWKGRKFAVTWAALGAGADPSYQFSEVEIWTGGVLRATFTPIKTNRFEYNYGDGQAAGLDSYIVTANGAVTIKVRRKNAYGSASSYATLAITQAAPTNPQTLAGTGVIRGVVFTWDKNSESDFKEYRVRTKVTSGGAFSAWAAVTDNVYARDLTAAEITASGPTASIYIEVISRDLYGNDSTTSSTNTAALTLSVGAMDMTNVPEGYNLVINSDFDNGFDGWTKYIGTRGTIENATSPKSGLKAYQNAAATHAYEYSTQLQPVQHDRAYIAEGFFKTISGSTGTAYLAVKLTDSAGANITGDGTWWYYPYNGQVPPADFTYASGVFGAGSAKPFPANARYMQIGFILNYGPGDRIMQVQGLRIREVIESAYIKDLAVTDAKINTLSVAKLTSDAITSKTITLAITEGAGDVKIQVGKTDFGQDGTAGIILGIDDSDLNRPKFELSDGTHYFRLGATLETNIPINADTIVSGSIRGINIQAGTFMTKGSYLTQAPAGGATTLYVKDTTDFAASGSGWIIDSTNDRDAFTYTGKTATTLTGCSGVLAHNNGAAIIPQVKNWVTAANINESRFFGDRGDGTIDQLSTIGVTSAGSDSIIGLFGSSNPACSKVGVYGMSGSSIGVRAYSYSHYAGKFECDVYNGKGQLYLPPMNDAVPDAITGSSGGLFLSAQHWLYVCTGGTNYKFIGPHLIYNQTNGSAATRYTAVFPQDPAREDGFEFEFYIVNSTGSSSNYSLEFNGDLLTSNYYRSTNGAAWANDKIICTCPANSKIIIRGLCTRGADGYIVSFTKAIVTNASNYYETYHRKAVTETSISSIAIVGSVALSVGVGSTCKIWRK